MWIFDGHLDLALNGVDWNRDLRQDVHVIRSQENSLKMTQFGRGAGTVSLPELRKANVRLGVATVFTRQERAINHSFGRTTPEACYAVAMAHFAYYRAMVRSGWMRQIRTPQELSAQVKLVESGTSAPFGYILGMECADAVLDPENIREWFDLGLRTIGLTHYGENRYGGGTRSGAGLTSDARPLLQLIESLGIALDLTHLSDRSFWEVAECYQGRVLASHQNARKFCDGHRQFSDEQLQFVIERNGVIGVSLDAIMLQPGWVYGVTKPAVTLERLVENIDQVCQLSGDRWHVGIGSDLDGGYGSEQTPVDLETIADLPKIADLLRRRGYKDADIQAIMHGNWERFFSEILPDDKT